MFDLQPHGATALLQPLRFTMIFDPATVLDDAEPPSGRPRRSRPLYAYSFDRESFRGRFASRNEAAEAAQIALSNYPTSVETIYVGRLVDREAPVEGLSAGVLEMIERRHRERGGASGLTDELADAVANEDACQELDDRLFVVLREWLADHGCLAGPGFEEISEHAPPLVSHVAAGASHEIGLIGTVG